MKRRALLVSFSALLSSPALAQTKAADTSRAVFWRPGDPGQRLHIRGRVTGPTGRPVPGAVVYFWQADGTAAYTERYQGTVETGADGGHSLITALPGQYAGNKHIHVAVEHSQHQRHRTEILFKGDNDQAGVETIALEEANIKGETVLLGRFDMQLSPL
jgi:protocatechuate 3,4-dioxygenase beta subunit